MEKNCLSCKCFLSYEVLYEDEFEPWDCGRCENGESDNFFESVNEDDCCEYHKDKSV